MIVRAQELSILTILLEYGKFIYFSKLKKESLRINQSIYKVLDIKPSHIIIKVILNYFQYFIFNSYKQTSLIKFYSIIWFYSRFLFNIFIISICSTAKLVSTFGVKYSTISSNRILSSKSNSSEVHDLI